MIITKEVILKIELSGESLKQFKQVLEGTLAANHSANQGLGFLSSEEIKYIQNILKQLKDE